jgi:hypothetical protein
MAMKKDANVKKKKAVAFKNASSSSSSANANQLKALKRKNRRIQLGKEQEDWDDFCLDRLFDPEELHYTPMPELLKRYKKRDLREARMYNLAKKYGNVNESRVRVITAPQMEKAGQRVN